MRIKILGEGEQARGKTFELLMISVLDRLGFTDFETNIRPAAMELDIEATHKNNGIRILCECKAHKDPISPDDVESFFSKLNYEIDKNYADKGLFFSISDFTSGVDRWYMDSGEITKKKLALYGAQEIVRLLGDSSLLVSDQMMDRIVRNNTNYQLGERYLVVFQSDVFIVQLLTFEGQTTSYMILRGSGNVVSVSIMDEISKLDDELAPYYRLNPVITKKVTLNLLDLKMKSLETIAVEIGESIEEVKTAIGDLQLQKIVKMNENESTLSINLDLHTLATLTRKFVSDSQRFDFMSSRYIDKAVNDVFVDFVIERFKIPVTPSMKVVLIRSARIFPSVLNLLLLGDNSRYQHFHNSFQKFQTHPKKPQLQDIISSMFFTQICEEIIYDLRDVPSTYLSKKEILGYTRGFELKFGSEFSLLIGIYGKLNTYIVNKEIGEEIRAGEIMSPVAVESIIRQGNHLLSIDEYQNAIETFNLAIKTSKDLEILSVAWNNKAQCFRMLGQHRRELQCINKALNYKKRPAFLSNKILCLETLGRKEEAEQERKKLEELRIKEHDL